MPTKKRDPESLVARLTSRKLWLAVGAFVTLVASEQYTEAVAVVMAYLGVEGAHDVVAKRRRAS